MYAKYGYKIVNGGKVKIRIWAVTSSQLSLALAGCSGGKESLDTFNTVSRGTSTLS